MSFCSCRVACCGGKCLSAVAVSLVVDGSVFLQLRVSGRFGAGSGAVPRNSPGYGLVPGLPPAIPMDLGGIRAGPGAGPGAGCEKPCPKNLLRIFAVAGPQRQGFPEQNPTNLLKRIGCDNAERNADSKIKSMFRFGGHRRPKSL